MSIIYKGGIVLVSNYFDIFFMMFDQKNFSQEVVNYSGLVLVDFFAPWCGPCQAQGPVIEELANEYKGKAKIGKLNIEEAIEVAQQYNVMSIPALIFFKNGKEVKRLDGFCAKDQLVQELDSLLWQILQTKFMI